MKIGIQTWGSLGDIKPLFHLAQGLCEAGHEVSFVYTSVDASSYDIYLADASFKIISLASPVLADQAAYQSVQRQIFKEKNPLKQVKKILDHLFVPAQEEMFLASQRLCEENDLVIGHFFCYPLHVASRMSHTPYVSVALVHNFFATKNYPPIGMPNFGGKSNLFFWKIVKYFLSQTLIRYPNRLEKQVGLAASKNIVDEIWRSKQLNLIAVSSLIAKPQDDWSADTVVCGFLGTHTTEAVSEELKRFLQAGDKPIYITFGSVDDTDVDKLHIFLEVLSQMNMRAIIQTPIKLLHTNNILTITRAPYDQVFSHCKAIVYHGGAGTTYNVLKAGVPAIIVPHIAEQEFWAHELQKLGVAVAIIKRSCLSSKTLSQAFKKLNGTKEQIENLKNISAISYKEDGVTKAVDAITKRFV